MKKIIIFSNHSKTDEGFLKLLNALFPECEIHIVSSNTENFREAQVTKEDTSVDEEGKKNSKYSYLRPTNIETHFQNIPKL